MEKNQKLSLLKVLFIFTFFTNYLSAQNYVKAVCKLNSGKTIIGVIKNDFKDDDEFLYFKEDEQEIKINLTEINELILNDDEKYISRLIEFHPNRVLNDLEIIENNNHDLNERISKQLLLHYLVKGKVNLYKTYLKGKTMFFYSEDNDINNIIYLEYYKYINSNNSISLNNFFSRQLLKNVNCNDYLTEKYNSLGYNDKDLIKVFDQFNICNDGVSEIYRNNNNNIFRLSVIGGVRFINGIFEANTNFFDSQVEESDVSPNLGAELSYILPNRKMNSEIFTRFNFYKMNFKSNETFKYLYGPTVFQENILFESNILEFALGFRYNVNSLMDNKKNNLAFDFSVNSSIPLNNSYTYKIQGTNGFIDQNIDFNKEVKKNVFSLSLGSSYTYLNKYILEARYTLSSHYLDVNFLSSKFSSISLNFRYLLFQNKK